VPNVSRPPREGQTATRKTARPTHGTCRLVLTINSTSYTVRPIFADSSIAVRAYRLRKGDGTIYDLVQTDHGLQCDCPDHLFRRDGIDPDGCKHLKALVACGLFDSKGGAR
jgi:hypothetical protein